ncbi:hypothetical protein PsYK624_042300 [Phanerochaete sordida]|uniref:Uncharacterized protein n=1 Tax=Phanerochaete sordida TaxID=48140 RepID=A0A9P3G317_9APHY|nr:hypothetical protein PsYK624_042300 [Phanerochaete sordida]
MASASAKPKAKGKGKQPKRFVEQKDTALQLASIIGDQQETRAKQKVERHQRHDKEPERAEHKSRPSGKDKLKEVKAALKAEKAKAKKEKAKAKKMNTGHPSDSVSRLRTDEQPPAKPRRRVAFA